MYGESRESLRWFLDPSHAELQPGGKYLARDLHHAGGVNLVMRSLLEGGKMIRYGAKSLPYGGWFAVPPLAGDEDFGLDAGKGGDA